LAWEMPSCWVSCSRLYFKAHWSNPWKLRGKHINALTFIHMQKLSPPSSKPGLHQWILMVLVLVRVLQRNRW
jgi:hypothetical protein